MDRREFLDRFVFVRKCGGCGEILDYEHTRGAFCAECVKDWHQAKAENCAECLRVVTECTCVPKGLSGKGMAALRKLIFYLPKHREKPRNKLIYFLKRHPNRRMARFVAAELWTALEDELRTQGWSERKDEILIVNIPRGHKAKIRYGFDQSELICRELSALCGIPFEGAIRRRRGGKEQKRLSRGKRFRNIRGLFYVKEKTPLAGRCVILMDDIVTSGASMAACLELMQKAGAVCVIGCAIAMDR